MVNIKITQGLDIPISGKPLGKIQPLTTNGRLVVPQQISLNLTPFEDIKFKLLTHVGDVVKGGQPLAEDKSCPGRMFVAPASGIVKEIRRGLKRRLLDIVIEVAPNEEFVEFPPLNVDKASKQEILERLMTGGLFAYIRQRPFNLLADPAREPRVIFIKALESAPFAVPAEMQIENHDEAFQSGLLALSKLTRGDVHLVYRKNTDFRPFLDAKNVQHHTVEGPHPSANTSVHIHHISPIQSSDDIVWTVTALDVISIGYLLINGHFFTDRVMSIAGPGVIPEHLGYFKARTGFPINRLISGRIEKGTLRLISGDPLTGQKVDSDDFLGFYHTSFCVIPENIDRQFLHFFRLGADKYTASGAYLSGHLDNSKREYFFTTNQHGEHRAFVIGSPYDKVMPMRIPTMPLVKALLAEDYDLAETLGLLEVDSEDFALPTFVCPSKMEMTEIVKVGLKQHAKEVLQ